MFKLENYKSNVDIDDKFSVLNVATDKTMIYNGPIHVIEKKAPVIKDNKHRPLASAVLGVNNTAAPLPDNSEFYDCWTDIDTQELYLSSKPTCYLILNKPGAAAYSIGEAISKKYNCIHLCPKNVINDEIEQASSTGKCLDYNFKLNNVLKFDYILTIIKKKLESPAVKHRGYVLSGLPLVTSNRDLLYLVNTLHSEEAVEVVKSLLFDLICNLKKKSLKNLKGSPHTSLSSEVIIVEEEEPEEEQEIEEIQEEVEEQSSVLPKFLLQSCFNVILPKKTFCVTKQTVLLLQLNELFNLSMTPDIIVYLTCTDIDLVTKKCHKYLNYANGLHTVDPFFVKQEFNTKWPEKYSISDYFTPYDSCSFNPKYSCRQPINFIENSIEQLCNYKQFILPFIEKKISRLQS